MVRLLERWLWLLPPHGMMEWSRRSLGGYECHPRQEAVESGSLAAGWERSR